MLWVLEKFTNYFSHRAHVLTEQIDVKWYFKLDFTRFRSFFIFFALLSCCWAKRKKDKLTGLVPFKNRFMADNKRITAVDTWKWESQVLISVFRFTAFFSVCAFLFRSKSTFLSFHETLTVSLLVFIVIFLQLKMHTIQTLTTYMCSKFFFFFHSYIALVIFCWLDCGWRAKKNIYIQLANTIK